MFSCLGTIALGSIVFVYDKLDGQFTKQELRGWTIGLLFPSVIAGTAFWLNKQVEIRHHRQLKEATQRSELREYLNRMTAIVKDGLLDKNENSYEYLIAKALTANVFRELSSDRTNQVMSFLDSLNLLGKKNKTKVNDNPETSHLTEPSTKSLLKGIKLSHSQLNELNAQKVDFRGANLKYSQIERADFFKANLERTNFLRSKLTKTNFYGANLRKADFYGAILEEANLEGANLEEANLKYAKLGQADLFRANLERANLEGADLSRANLGKVNFANANLKYANFKKTVLSQHLSEEQQNQCVIYEPVIVQSDD